MTQADPYEPTTEQREIAEVAFAIGAKYADRRFDDHSASLAQWEDLSAAGLTGLSLPEEHGGAAGMLELCMASERLAAGGFPAAKLVIATAIAGSMIARHGTESQSARWLPGIAAGTTRFDLDGREAAAMPERWTTGSPHDARSLPGLDWSA